MAISAEETFRIMRSVAEAAGWRVDAEPEADGSKRVILTSMEPPPEAPSVVKPLRPEELDVRPAAGRAAGEIVLSVVFGTYQRLDVMRRAVESVRASAGRVSCECVVCDGGSDDGSREWLAAQPDVVLVGKRSLDGAVDAFNHAYRLSRGGYVANFNDDAVYVGDALEKAVRFMDSNPGVGQAIFSFRGAGEDYGINEIYPGHPGTEYANFGITRREALEQVAFIQGGFWNPIYRTYAADCEQSAWMHRLSWKVARLDDLKVVDVRTKDGLRTTNENRQPAETKLMYHRWPLEAFRPDGPKPRVSAEEWARFGTVKERKSKVQAKPRSTASVYAEVVGFPLPHEEDRLLRQGRAVRALDPVEGQFPKRAEVLPEERVLYVHLETKADPQAGLDRALRKLGSGGFAKVGWMEFADFGKRQEAIVEAAAGLRPTFVFMQLQSPNVVSVDTVRRIREVSGPKCVVATWNGDIADVNSPWSAQWQVPFERACDLTLHASMSHVRVLRSLGVHSAGFLNIGFDQVQYTNVGRQCRGQEDFDVCFLGSKYDGDNFSKSLKWHDAFLRNDAVLAMRKAFGDRFGVFGRGWAWSRNPGDSDYPGSLSEGIPLSQAHTAYWRSKIGLNVSLANYMEAYSSDRLHRILGCGSLALVKRFPMMSTWGLIERVNCLGWDSPDEAVSAARRILEHPDELAAIAAAGAELARERLTWDARMFELAALIEAVRS